MKRHILTLLTALLLGGVGSAAEIAIRTGDNPSAMETLAARELRRYLYLTSGTLPVLEGSERDRLTIRLELGADLGPEAFTLIASPDGRTQRIVGGSPLGLLYGTYRFIEHQGVRYPGSGWVPNEIGDGSVSLNTANCASATGWYWFWLRLVCVHPDGTLTAYRLARRVHLLIPILQTHNVHARYRAKDLPPDGPFPR